MGGLLILGQLIIGTSPVIYIYNNFMGSPCLYKGILLTRSQFDASSVLMNRNGLRPRPLRGNAGLRPAIWDMHDQQSNITGQQLIIRSYNYSEGK